MAQVPIITERTVEKLSKYLDSVNNLVDQGHSPTEALKKVAEENNLSPEYIRSVGIAYNSGLTNYYIHHEKRATALYDTELCEPEKVIKELFTPRSKKAEDVDPFYLYSPAFHDIGRYRPPEPVVKAAEFRSVESISKEINTLIQHKRKEKEILESELKMIYELVDADLRKIASYYERDGAIDPHIVNETCKTLNIVSGPILKAAEVSDNKQYYSKNTTFSNKLEPYRYIIRINEFTKKANIIRDKIQVLDNELAIIDKKLEGFKKKLPNQSENELNSGKQTKTAQTTPPAPQTTSPSSQTKSPSSQIKPPSLAETYSKFEESRKKIFDFASSTFDEEAVAYPRNVIPVDKAQPEHSKDILKANANVVKVILTNLMLNDPIISKYEPEKVLDAYSKLAALAPAAMTREVIMVPLLQKILETGTLDPLDVANLIKFNLQIAKHIENVS
jgi:hypothetical protein